MTSCVHSGHLDVGGRCGALTNKGILYIWSHKIPIEDINLEPITSLKSPINKFDIGGNFIVAIDLDGTIYSWGNNLKGELGQGNYEYRNDPSPIPSLTNKNIYEIACGESHIIVVGNSNADKNDSVTTPRMGSNKLDIEISQLKTKPLEVGKASQIEKELESILSHNNEILSRIRDMEIKAKIREQGFNVKYKNKLESSNAQLEIERGKINDLEKELREREVLL